MSVILQGPRARVANTLFRFDARECVDEAGLYGLSYGKRVAAVLSRPSRKRVADQRGRLFTVPVGAPAIGVFGGEAGVLLELARTNLCWHSEAFDNASWQKQNGLTVSANSAVAPDGTLTADTLVGDGSTSSQAVYTSVATFTADGTKCASVYLRAGTGNTSVRVGVLDGTVAVWRHLILVTWTEGVPSLSTALGTGTLYPVEALANGWYRISFSAEGVIATNLNCVYIYTGGGAASAGSVYAWGAQAENAAVPSSYIPTAAGAVTRSADSCYFDVPGLNPPRAMTMYVRGVNRGTFQLAESRVMQVGAASDFDPRITIYNNGGSTVACFYSSGTAGAAPSIFSVPSVGQLLEACAALDGNGVVTVGASIDGAAEAVAGPSAAAGLGAAWSAARVYLNSIGSSAAGQFAFGNIVIAEGVRSLAEPRELAGL